MSRVFASGFAEDLDGMIRLKVSLGYSERTYLDRASSFDRYCGREHPGCGSLTQGVVLGWMKSANKKSSPKMKKLEG